MFRKSSAFFLMIPLALTGVPRSSGQSSDRTYKHAAQYQVAILDQNLRVATGYDVTLGKSMTDAKLNAGGQGIHLLHTDAGDFRVEAPVNKGMTIAVALLTPSYVAKPTYHNKWFMDGVASGTKVLFASECSRPSKKHPNETVRCEFWFPDPDSTNHEYATLGDFTPYIAGNGSNTQNTANVLCGKGKLSPAVEAQLCTPAAAVPVPPPMPVPVAVQASIVAAAAPVLPPVAPAANTAAMVSPPIGSTLAGSSATFTWTSAGGSQSLWLGSTGVGSKDLYVSIPMETNSIEVTALPTNGETVNARLWTNINGNFIYTDYTYKAAASTRSTEAKLQVGR